MNKSIKIAIVEDDYSIRTSINDYFDYRIDIDCIGAYDSVESFIEDAPKQHFAPNVLLLDYNLAGMSGVDGIVPIKQIYPDLDIIMLTIHSHVSTVFEALQAGATGYLLKGVSLEAIADAIIQQYNGGAVMSPTIARQMISFFINKDGQDKNHKEENRLLASLTPKEHEVVKYLADGLSYKLVAEKMNISVNTIPSHIKNIYRKLEVNSKTEVLLLYTKNKKFYTSL